MALSDSNRRTIRTLVHALVAGLTAAPTFLPWLINATAGTPIAAHVAVVAGVLSIWVAIVAGLLNKAEDLGLVPTWLRDEVTPIVVTTPSATVHIDNVKTADIEKAVASIKAALNKGNV